MDFSKMTDDELAGMVKILETEISSNNSKAVAKQVAADKKTYSPTAQKSKPGVWGTLKEDANNLAAGVGKVGYDTARGVGNLVTDAFPSAEKYGFATRKDTDEANKRDKPLMDTKAGIAGNVLGNVSLGAPLALLPGGSSILGGIALGAGMGAIQPVGENDSRLHNMQMGAEFGGIIPAAVRGYKMTKAALNPLTDAGQKELALKLISNQAANSQNAARSISANKGETAGFAPTMGQASNDAGVASLERTARAMYPGEFDAVNKSQRKSLSDALLGIAKTPEERAMQEAYANKVAKNLYGQAFKEEVPVTPELLKMMQRPTMQEAEKRAVGIAKEGSIPFNSAYKDIGPKEVVIPGAKEYKAIVPVDEYKPGTIKYETLTPEEYNPYTNITPGYKKTIEEVPVRNKLTTNETISEKLPHNQILDIPPVESVPVRDMHTIKMGMDSQLRLPGKGLEGIEAEAIRKTRNEFLDMLPESYQTARQAHAGVMKPVNQMDIGDALYKKLVPSLADDTPAGVFSTRSNNYAQALRNGDELARDVTGIKSSTMANTMEPEQMRVLNGVKNDASLMAGMEANGRGTGSDTLQKLSMSNLIRETGLPEMVKRYLPADINLFYKNSDEAVRRKLIAALLNPQDYEKDLAALASKSKLPERVLKGVQALDYAAIPSLPAVMNLTKE